MPQKSDKSQQWFMRYHDFKIERSDWSREFFAKSLKTEFSQGNKWCNLICNHKKHGLAQISAKGNDVSFGRNGQNGILVKKRPLSLFFTPGPLTYGKVSEKSNERILRKRRH